MSTSTPKFKVYGRSTALGAPIFINQEKTVDLTENGNIEITPDEGHVLTKVKVNARVPFVDLPEDAFTLTGNCSYRFAGSGRQWWLDLMHGYATCRNITNLSYMFYMCDIDGFSFTIDGSCEDIPYQSMYRMFKDSNIKHAGTIRNVKVSNMGEMFSAAKYLRYLPRFENIDYTYARTLASVGSSNASDTVANFRSMFERCLSLREISPDFLKELYSPEFSGSISSSSCGPVFYLGFESCLSLNEIVGISPITGEYTSSTMTNAFRSCMRVKNIIFDTNPDGTPYEARWKSQTIDLTTLVGIAKYTTYAATDSTYGSYEMLHYNSGITMDKRVTDDTTYQALKDDPDWWTSDVNYSRYNHDSAVNTINSLPDTSAYLAEKGGTNTIKFKGAAGALTDGGAINTLTEEEIAVATAKGWTVTFS